MAFAQQLERKMLLPHSRPVLATSEKFETAVLFLQLCLPSTLIHHEKRAFRKTLFKAKEFENFGFAFLCGRKGFENDIIIFPCPSFPKWPVIVLFLTYSGVVWTENIWRVLRVKTSKQIPPA